MNRVPSNQRHLKPLGKVLQYIIRNQLIDIFHRRCARETGRSEACGTVLVDAPWICRAVVSRVEDEGGRRTH